MQATFQKINESLAECGEYDTDDALCEASRNLIGFFETLIQIDFEQPSVAKAMVGKKDKSNENIRSEHSIHQTE